MAARCITRSCSRISVSTPSSAAQAFLQLAPRRYLHNAPPVLDFLLPSVSVTAVCHEWTRKTSFPRSRVEKRVFTSSARRQATTAIFNPRKDDDGKDINIEITPRAANRLSEIMKKDSNPNLALRITVESGGCHGFQYLMSLTTLPSPLGVSNSVPDEAPPSLNTSSIDPNAMPSGSPTSGTVDEEQLPALNISSNDSNDMPSAPAPGSTQSKHAKGEKEAKLEEDDTVFEANGARVVMDGPSLELLKDSKVDFTMELIGSQFKIVDNPLATSSCGCGTSFDIKI
ncbi:related to iron transport protein [Phialocephala subalpina]|uniref:Related to iron transport protein n=1 Tax=Phialocephala subalpina TaxID=576137 RepID=A0A1L7X4R0_9HELO|nr:related to iron transport protein [Phialocephala subalpina]